MTISKDDLGGKTLASLFARIALLEEHIAHLESENSKHTLTESDIASLRVILERCLEEVEEPDDPDSILIYLTRNREELTRLVGLIRCIDPSYIHDADG